MSMVTPSAANGAQRLRRHEAVVSALLEHGTMSRTELAEITGYSQSSMTSSIRHLIRLGHVIETGRGRSTGGRRRTLLEFDRRSVLLMILSVDAGHMVARQVDLSGTVHVQVRRKLDPEHPQAAVTAAVEALQNAAEAQSTCAIISMPGVVSADGDVSLAPALGASPGRRLQDLVAEISGLHTIGENDVNLLALGESEDGAVRDGDDFGLIYVGDGIGGALVLNGQVRRGATGSAGEIGFLPWSGADGGTLTRAVSGTAVGPLEYDWSVPALSAKAEAIGIESGTTHIVTALEQSDSPDAAILLGQALDAWAYAAIVLTCVVNPGRIVLAGDAATLGPASREALADRVRAGSPSPVDVCYAELGDRAIVSGAIAQVRTAPWIFLPEEDSPHPQSPEPAAPDSERRPGPESMAEPHPNNETPYTNTPHLEGEI
ncbi:ROK family transcriptional regulator [Brachybacterium massiliense]|uniref:ROK family transcriptional regulator n=1 Tax=Brachybacterium massiliense TaxID=1755098 RepID=UPI000B3BAF2E|nr:ROK family transcriptional regulator [Brachybacterium massiliense]